MAVLEELEGTIQTAVERTGPAVIGLGQGWGRGSGFVIDSNRIPVSYTHLTLPTILLV